MRKFYWLVVIAIVFGFNASAQTFSLLKDIYPGSTSGLPLGFANFNGNMYFTVYDQTFGHELWKTDGTGTGTVMLKDIWPGKGASNTPYSSAPHYITNLTNCLVFVADDWNGGELWRSDGTADGTVLLKDINPGISGSGIGNTSSPFLLTKSNNIIFFVARNGMYGEELWKTDGTEAGTIMVKDINPGTVSSSPRSLVNINGILFFTATDPVNGIALWKSDGTEAGTVLVKDINPGLTDSPETSYLTNVNGTLFFKGYSSLYGSELWKSDGTDAGTVLVKDINPGPGGIGNTRWFIPLNGMLLFTANDGVNGVELWKSDGTEDGTVMLKDLNPGLGDGINKQNVVSFNGQIYFAGYDVVHGEEVWKTDGTEAGTVLLKDISPMGGSSIGMYFSIGVVNNYFLFMADDGSHGGELWRTDGTEAGTFMLQDIFPGATGSHAGGAIVVNDKVIITAVTPLYGQELMVANLNSVLPLSLTAFRGQLSNNDGLLNWNTSSEQNTSLFEIERSIDRKNFTKIGTIAASGNSSTEKQYAYTDRDIRSLHVPVVYYRLKSKDIDSKFTYSKIIAINISSSETVVMLYPSPVMESATLMIAARKKESMVYSIIDMNGRTVQQKNISVTEGSNMITLETNTLAAGIYTIVLNTNNMSNRVKFVKQ